MRRSYSDHGHLSGNLGKGMTWTNALTSLQGTASLTLGAEVENGSGNRVSFAEAAETARNVGKSK